MSYEEQPEAKDEWEEKKKLGDAGVQFFMDNYPGLLKRQTVMEAENNTAIQGKDRSEGADIEALILRYHIEGFKTWSGKDYYEWAMKNQDKESAEDQLTVFDQIIHGAIEVKARKYEQFLARNDISYNCGTVQFAIWNSNTNEPIRMRLGSLYRMFYPGNANHERQPVTYAEIHEDRTGRPYACMAFEDFPALKKRLIEIGREKYGLDLTEKGFSEIPCRKDENDRTPDEWAEKKQKENGKLILRGNMWHVPFCELKDLATVTTIGDPPDTSDFNRCRSERQRARLAYLTKYSQGRHIPYKVPDETERKRMSPEKIKEIEEEIRKIQEQKDRRRDIFETMKRCLPSVFQIQRCISGP